MKTRRNKLADASDELLKEIAFVAAMTSQEVERELQRLGMAPISQLPSEVRHLLESTPRYGTSSRSERLFGTLHSILASFSSICNQPRLAFPGSLLLMISAVVVISLYSKAYVMDNLVEVPAVPHPEVLAVIPTDPIGIGSTGDLPQPLTFVATAYYSRGRTASGKMVSKGLIAADPNVLPLGSRVKMQHAGHSEVYIVADISSHIRGRRIDIWTPSSREALRFGKRTVKITVISYGERRPKRSPKS